VGYRAVQLRAAYVVERLAALRFMLVWVRANCGRSGGFPFRMPFTNHRMSESTLGAWLVPSAVTPTFTNCGPILRLESLLSWRGFGFETPKRPIPHQSSRVYQDEVERHGIIRAAGLVQNWLAPRLD